MKKLIITGILFTGLIAARSITHEKSVKVSPGSIRAAVNKSIPLLESSSHTFLDNANGCYSCHGQALSAVAFKLARDKGFTVRDSIFSEALDTIYTELTRGKAVFTQCSDPISLPIGTGYGLWALAVNGYKVNKSIHLLIRDLIQRQTREGNWAVANNRPPLEYSTYTGTALDVRAIQAYAPPSMQATAASSIQKARHWLEHADAYTNEERVFQLLGLIWTNADAQVISRQAGKLLALQRPDGGWSQLDSLPSDAYATGKSLYVLNQSGQLPTEAPAYQKGLAFLLSTQYPDGSWNVQTRTHPSLPFIDSGFPHGKNQFISAAGSNWATMALLLAVK